MTVANMQTVKMTAEQYFQLGEDPPGVRLELIDGEIIVSPSAYPSHAHVIARLTKILMSHIDRRNLGKLFLDTDVPFEEHMVRRPDMCFYAAEHLDRVTPMRLTAPPDLCIEVLSPGTADDDRTNKFKLYQKHAVPHYWIIDAEERTAECFARVKGKYKLTASGRANATVKFLPFADLAIPLADLWMPGT